MIKTMASGVLISAIAISLPLWSAAPFHASASAAVWPTGRDFPAERIDAAFALLSRARVDPLGAATPTRTPKGDFLRPPECASEIWRNIDPSCLLMADGAAAPRVRTITIGLKAGVNTTVLFRIPAAEAALH